MMLATVASAFALLPLHAQVTFMGSNNFFKYFFTDTGFSSYDWRYEPQQTDLQRGQLKGSIVKVVTNITDKTGRGFGEHFTDTTYYDMNGNITKIIAPKIDAFNPQNKFRPDVWTYTYDTNGRLDSYTLLSETDSYDGHYMTKTIHTMTKDINGNIVNENTRYFTQKQGKDWEDSNISNPISWEFKYDSAGNLIGGKGYDLKLTYTNGRISKMETDTKPVTYTYDAAGRLTNFKFYVIDGMDEEIYAETQTTLTYNQQGDIIKGVKSIWDCNANWVRKKIIESSTYTLNYTYDNQGNWTKAIVFSRYGKSKPKMAFTILRTITYNNHE